MRCDGHGRRVARLQTQRVAASRLRGGAGGSCTRRSRVAATRARLVRMEARSWTATADKHKCDAAREPPPLRLEVRAKRAGSELLSRRARGISTLALHHHFHAQGHRSQRWELDEVSYAFTGLQKRNWPAAARRPGRGSE